MEAKLKLFEALSKFQAECPRIKKDKEVDMTLKSGRRVQYDYADLSSIIEITKPHLSKHGLAVFHTMKAVDANSFSLVTHLTHSSGAFETSEMPVSLVSVGQDGKSYPKTPQDIGGTITYFRRYSYCAIIGVQTEDEDDDAVQASGKTAVFTPKKPALKAVNPLEQPWPEPEDIPQLRNKPETHIGESTFPKGKYEGLRIRDVPSSELPGYIKFLRGKEKEMGKPITDPMLSVIQEAEIFLQEVQ